MPSFGAANNANFSAGAAINFTSLARGNLAAGGQLQSVSIYNELDFGGGEYRVAVYQGGAGNNDFTGATLVWDSGQIAATDPAGWKTLSASGTLVPGRTWIAVKSNGNMLLYYCDDADSGDLVTTGWSASGQSGLDNNPANAFPATASVTGGADSSETPKVRLDVAPAGSLIRLAREGMSGGMGPGMSGGMRG